MAKIRVGFSSDFNVKGNNVGFGTTNPTALLNVVDTLKGDFNISGVTTLTSYGGFVAQNQRITQDHTVGYSTVGVGTVQQYYETETGYTDLGGVHHGDDQYFNTLSEDLIIEDGQILNITNTEMVGVTTIGEYDPHTHASQVCAGSLEQVSVTGHFSVPNGGINERQETPIEGTVRFNDDLATLEFFNGDEWRQFTYNQRSGRVIIAGGYGLALPSVTKHMQSMQVMTLGSAEYFGELDVGNTEHIGCGSEIRGLFGGGYVPTVGRVDYIQYVTMTSASNAIDFGDLTIARNQAQAVSSSTRGVWGGGHSSGLQTRTDYVEIATKGDALQFGDLTEAKSPGAVANSPTRGVFISGYRQPHSFAYTKTEYITIASAGNAVDFGEAGILIAGGSCGSSTRGIFGGGYQRNPATVNLKTLSYLTMASFGNSIDFGNLTVDMTYASAGGNSVRGVFTGSDGSPHVNDNIDYVSVTSLGDAHDFGDLAVITGYAGAVSDSHGGLGGF